MAACQVEGADALVSLIEQLEGFALPAFAWEKDVLPARIQLYLPQYLDQLCNTGRLTWRRFVETKSTPDQKGRRRSLLRNSAISLLPRAHQAFWPVAIDRASLSSPATKLMQVLDERGACFYDELQAAVDLLFTVELCRLDVLVASHGSLSLAVASARDAAELADRRPQMQPVRPGR